MQTEGINVVLFVQREEEQLTVAAIIPVSSLVDVWCKQRDVSTELISAGKLGRRKKNHAMNGQSPTLWLEDGDAPEVANAVWNYPDVIDVLHPSTRGGPVDDTLDDLAAPEPASVGSDGESRIRVERSQVKRDPRVRQLVLDRAKGRCEGCGTSREFKGFLDVHHVLGVETSDRVWNCVAVCPNCHREAHFSPEREALNARLLARAEDPTRRGKQQQRRRRVRLPCNPPVCVS